MDILEAIQTRRSNGNVLADKPVPRELIEKVLKAGTWAPTHHRSEPWRFVTFSGEGRNKLAAALPEGKQNKVFRAPVVILVWCAAGRSANKNPPVWEDHAATAACCQNMLLAAHELGLGAIWRSGKFVDLVSVHALCEGYDAAKGDRVMGFIYLGYPDPAKPEPLRPQPKLENKLTWFDAP